ncbi:MAG: Gfo/Idh/MocA family protein [Gemmataceae bacterium]
MMAPHSRRKFIASTALSALAYSRVLGAADNLRLAAVGVGGQGWSDLSSVAASPRVDVTALCDIDESRNHLGRASEKFPSARRFSDWRRLFDESKSFDAVIVATPDHMHAPVGLAALSLGKHVYCEKPLTHTVFEARQMALAARKYNCVTQMGNQIQSHSFYRTAVKLVHRGLVGKIQEVHSWQAGRLVWMLVDQRPEGGDPVPPEVNWNLWLGAAPERPYKQRLYHPFNWRAWQDFSNGQLGDFGCHILDPVFSALKLTAPRTIRASDVKLPQDLWMKRCKVAYTFPGTDLTANRTIDVTWYDGDGHYPALEKLGLPAGFALPGSGSVLVGDKGSLLIPHVGMPRLFLRDGGEAKMGKEDIVPGINHYTGWADACRGEGKTFSSFAYSGPLSETVLLGTLASRFPEATLTWDSEAMKLTGQDQADSFLRKTYRKGWEPAWLSRP